MEIPALDAVTRTLVAWEPVADRFTLSFDPIHAELNKLPVAADTLRYLLAIFLAFPISMLYSQLPSGIVKHAMDAVVGIVLAMFVFGAQWMIVVVAALAVYILLILGSTLKLRALPLLVFGFMLAFMTISHLVRQYEDYMGWSLDITGPLMILTIKLSSLGYQYTDGVTDIAKVRDRVANGKGGEQRMYTERLDRALFAIPNIVTYFGFVFCPNTFFAGPAFDLKEYLNATQRPASDAAKLPSRAMYVLQTVAAGLFCLALTGYGKDKYPMTVGTAPDVRVNPFILDAQFPLANALFTLIFVRAKYHFAWKLAEASSVIAGFGYEPRDNSWTGAANIDILGFEFAPNLSAGSKAWNKHTQKWLERYVFKRSPRAWSMLLTYSVSAFWHGFYPGYYLFFLSTPLVQNASKLIRARVRPLTLNTTADGAVSPKWFKPIYDVLSIIVTHASLNYLSSAFVVLSYTNGITIWNSYGWMIHIAAVLVYVVIYAFIPAPKPKRS